MCVCSPRTPGHLGRGNRANTPAGKCRAERVAGKMRHANFNLMDRRFRIVGATVGPGIAQVIDATPVEREVAFGGGRFNRHYSAALTGKNMPNCRLTSSLHCRVE
jgi:hypothetical protein